MDEVLRGRRRGDEIWLRSSRLDCAGARDRRCGMAAAIRAEYRELIHEATHGVHRLGSRTAPDLGPAETRVQAGQPPRLLPSQPSVKAGAPPAISDLATKVEVVTP